MSELQTKAAAKPIQVYLPCEVVDKIDSLAESETISRVAWVRRLIIGTTKNLTEKVPA